MKFTIAIPTYNNAETLSKAIESCVNQQYDNNEFEIIVVDNASTDDTPKILNEFKDKITTYRNEKTCSLYKNHNICLEKANGQYIIFCHSDDTLNNIALNTFDLILKKRGYPEKYVLWGRSLFRDFKVEWDRSSLPLDTVLAGEDAFRVFTTGGLTPSGTCFSTASLRDLKGFYLVESKSAPSDSISYWKMIVNQFEFEMSSRLVYKRTEASTATGQNYTKAKRIAALTEAFAIAFNDKDLYKTYVQKFFKRSTNNYIADISLTNVAFYKRPEIIKYYMYEALKCPSIGNISKLYNIIRWT